MRQKSGQTSAIYMTILLSAIILIACSSLIGCSNYEPQKYMLGKEEAAKEKTKEQMQVANPATLNCMNTTGASWTTREGDSGQIGICTFADGSWCEEWAYMRGQCAPGLNMTLCKGQFWGKSVCPSDYSPVCVTLAELDPTTNKTVRTEQETATNACSACVYSKQSMTPLGYVEGRCD